MKKRTVRHRHRGAGDRSVVAQAANADALDDIKKSGKIRIAVDLGVPPYGMTDDKMQPTGSDIETAKAAGQGLGPAVRARADHRRRAHSGAADRQGRPRDLDALDHARARQGHRLLARAMPCCARSSPPPRASTLKSMADLDGKTVGTVRGTTHDTQLTKEGPKGMKLVRYEDDATEAQAFLSGQVDIFSTAEMLVAADRQEEPGPPGRGQVRARQLQARHRRQEGREAARSRKSTSGSPPTSRTAGSNAIYKKYLGNDLPDVILKQ